MCQVTSMCSCRPAMCIFHHILFSRHHIQFSSVALLCPTLCNPMTAAHQASLSITNSRSLPKLMSIESVMPSNHLIFCLRFFSSSISAIRVVSSAYLRLLIFILAILIPACASSSPAFLMMHCDIS